MTIAQNFIVILQSATQKRFWETPLENATFQDVLNQYANYYHKLNRKEQAKISTVFWEHIKLIGTPVIENRVDGQSEVYFLYPRDKLANIGSIENDIKKELYLQGDFHGYGSTLKSSQELSRLPGTNIMYRSNTIPKDAWVSYYYVQLDPKHGGKKASDFYGDLASQPPSFFSDNASILKDNKSSTKTQAEIQFADALFYGIDNILIDELSRYRKAYDIKSSFFSADPDEEISHLGLQFDKHNPNLKDQYLSGLGHKMRINIVSKCGEIEDYPTDPKYFSTCTRSINVYVPESENKIDHVLIINDGKYYQLGKTYERIYERFGKNTAIVFISPEQGLEAEAKKNGIEFEPADTLTGMGVRTIDYKYRVDEYAEFIHKKLLPNLVLRGIKIPEDPKKRILIGSSLSATASIYIGFTYPTWFGKVVAQSPSMNNKIILKKIIDKGMTLPPPEIFLSCGKYESPVFAKNLNMPFAEELAALLNIKLHIYPHGHQMEGWSQKLNEALLTLGISVQDNPQNKQLLITKDTKNSTEFSHLISSSIFSYPQKSSGNSDNACDKEIWVRRKKGG